MAIWGFAGASHGSVDKTGDPRFAFTHSSVAYWHAAQLRLALMDQAHGRPDETARRNFNTRTSKRMDVVFNFDELGFVVISAAMINGVTTPVESD